MRRPLLWLLLSFASLCPTAHAQKQGFQLNRYEPTPTGEGTFFVDHPFYSRTRRFSAGLTLNYGHDPLVLGRLSPDGTFRETQVIIGHQLLLHFDLALSLFDRLTLSTTLPVTLLERGEEAGGVGPAEGGAVGDPRLGLMVRLFGQPDGGPFSLHLGAALWVPLRKFTDSLPQQASDQEVRVLPKLVAAGLHRWLRWSATLGFLYRAEATIGDIQFPSGSTVGSAVQFGAAAAYADPARRFLIGPELLLSTKVTEGNAFQKDYTGLEILLCGHYQVQRVVQLGLALGLGALREPGTPDFRLLLRAAYAPLARPAQRLPSPAARGRSPRPRRLLLPPPPDRDMDRVPDAEDRCPDEPSGLHPDERRPGCPLPDRDGDSVVDDKDACPDKPGAPNPDPQKSGCPGLVEVKGGQLRILDPVFFATAKDRILPRSFPVLQAVADALAADAAIRRLTIEGHTDDRGPMIYNTELSQRRAVSVQAWLVAHGVAEGRLVAKGYGPLRPLKSNATAAGRAENRRVEFHIVDPAP